MSYPSDTPVMRLVTPIGHDFWRDAAGKVYYSHLFDRELNVIRGHWVIRGADPATFEVLNQNWARDARHVYIHDRRLKADRESFEILNHIYARDRDSVFYLSGTAKEIDRDSFEVLDTGQQSDGPCTYTNYLTGVTIKADWYGYARDATNVYFHEMLCGKPRIIRKADRDSFEVVEGQFSRDKDWVFMRETRVKSADRATFVHVPSFKDRDDRQ